MKVHKPAKIGVMVILAYFVSAPMQAVLSQTDSTALDTASLEAAVENYQATLTDLQSSYSNSTIELNRDLARTLAQLERHEEAASAFEQALQSMRIRDGLYSEEQLTLLEAAIESAIDDRNWELVERDFNVALSILERALPSSDSRYEKWVRWYTSWTITAYQYELDAGQSANSLQDALSYFESLSASLSEQDPNYLDKLLTYTREESLIRYFNLLSISATPYDEFDSQASETVSGQRCYVVMRNGQPTTICSNTQVPNPDFFESRQQTKANALEEQVREIRASYQNLISTLESNTNSAPEMLAMAVLELGDMNFMLRDMSRAHDLYLRAHTILAEAGIAASVPANMMEEPRNIIGALFDGTIDQFTIQPSEPTGLVSFDVTEDGRVRNLGIIGQGADLEEVNQELIAERLRNSVYRPRLEAGVPVSARIERLPAADL